MDQEMDTPERREPISTPAARVERAVKMWIAIEGATEWTNPLDVPLTATCNLPDPADGRQNVRFDVTFAPGETRALPVQLDRAIHDIREGVIVGGACHWLVRRGQSYGISRTLVGKDNQNIPTKAKAAAHADVAVYFPPVSKGSRK